MKKNLLTAALMIAGLFQLSAQCTITPGCSTASGYCTTPASNTNLPNAMVVTSYSTVIQLSLGSSAMGAPISSATLTSITGFPSGVTYSTNPTSGILPANSNGCILISGTPASSTAGTYTITANVSVSSTSGFLIPVTASWYLTVDPAVTTGIKSNVAPANVMLMAPNPAKSELKLTADFHLGKIQIIDALGKVVAVHDGNYSSETTIDVRNLETGIYFLQANDGSKLITRKFIKE